VTGYENCFQKPVPRTPKVRFWPILLITGSNCEKPAELLETWLPYIHQRNVYYLGCTCEPQCVSGRSAVKLLRLQTIM